MAKRLKCSLTVMRYFIIVNISLQLMRGSLKIRNLYAGLSKGHEQTLIFGLSYLHCKISVPGAEESTSYGASVSFIRNPLENPNMSSDSVSYFDDNFLYKLEYILTTGFIRE